MLCFMETQIKTQYGLIKYERATKFTLEEGSFLSKAIKEAFLLLNSSAQKLKKGEIDENLTATLFKDPSGLSATLDGLIASFKDKSLKCVRESVYEGNEGGAEASVLSSVSEDSGEIKIYDAFFDTKQIGDDRAGVIIHEAAHLAGLRGEGNADSADLESAEAVKNFCLCVNGRLSLEEIAAEAEAPENPDSDELTYNPDQARAPKGQSNGGQWVAEGDNGGATSHEKNSSAEIEKNSTYEHNLKKIKFNNIDKNEILFDKEKQDFITEAKKILSGEQKDYANIQKGEIQRNDTKLWMAFNALMKTPFKGRQTVLLDIAYTTIDSSDGEILDTRKEPIAFDANEDNGIIGLWRVTALGGPENYMEGTNLTIDIDIYTLEGPAKDNFKSFKTATSENGFASDAITHAKNQKYVITGSSECYNDSNGGEYKGGSVKGIPIENEKKPVKIFSRKIEFDGKETKADNMSRTALDKYGNDSEIYKQ